MLNLVTEVTLVESWLDASRNVGFDTTETELFLEIGFVFTTGCATLRFALTSLSTLSSDRQPAVSESPWQ
jgi:hypothetical protein